MERAERGAWGVEERNGSRAVRGDCNWTTVQPVETELFWGPRLAPRSFVHPFVAVSNKNYDRLSHMLSLRRGPEAQMPRDAYSSRTVLSSGCCAQLSRYECRESAVGSGESSGVNLNSIQVEL